MLLLGLLAACAAAALSVNRFYDEDPDGPVDAWMDDMVIPPIDATVAPRVALVCLWVGKQLPPWIDYFIKSASYSADKGVDACLGLQWLMRRQASISGSSTPTPT